MLLERVLDDLRTYHSLDLLLVFIHFFKVGHIFDLENFDTVNLRKRDNHPRLRGVAVEADVIFVDKKGARVEDHEAFKHDPVVVHKLADLALMNDCLRLVFFRAWGFKSKLFNLLL